tara:strand:+ start:576 stop:821 length:246 start_codon:yes stop_codon:yes gene_type:complete
MSEETRPPTTRAGLGCLGHFSGYDLTVQLQAAIDGSLLHIESYPSDVNLWLDDYQLMQIGTAIADHLGLVMVEANQERETE